jgi:pyrroline-5-carboxylate reductase
MHITFIGGGNMARSLIGGLIEAGTKPGNITVSDPMAEIQQHLNADFGIVTGGDNAAAISNAGVVVLAIKPQQMRLVVSELSGKFEGKLVISVAAGVLLSDIVRWSGKADTAVVRCMPNTPALLGCGATGLYANDAVQPAQKQQAEVILAAAGISAWLDTEAQLDAITALSGSGPAYFFQMIESMINSAEKMGIPEPVATQFAIQTALGAARMASEGDTSPAQLRRNVTSPAGTTEAAINSFTSDNFGDIVNRAMKAAESRAQELGKELGADHG